MKKFLKKFILTNLYLFLFSSYANALCKGAFINPITEVGWVNMFPVKIGGVTIVDSSQPDTNDNLSSPVCVCVNNGQIKIGITVSLWEPYRTVDSVFDPGCFPSLGMSVNFVTAGHEEGGIQKSIDKQQNAQFFAQSHLLISPFLVVLNLLTDVTCLDKNHPDLDIAYITEVDPTWNDDIAAMVLNPEVLLFSNPVTGFACIADAIKSAFGLPADALFWCMGSWESAYPLTGANDQDTIIDGACTTAGRLIYKMNRQLLMLDRALDYCAAVMTPIWIKSHYRLQPVRPRAMTTGAIRIGQNTDTWAYKLFDPFVSGYGNWSFLIWRKINCCMGWSPTP